MNIYENYIETLLEDKPIGDKNKELWLEYLKKNFSKNDKDIFVTFVSEDKVGINPKSIWNTPNGIYAYPIKFILDDNKIPFRGSIKPKKIKVIKVSSSKILDSGLTKQMYEKCLVVLKPKILEKIETYNENKKAVINTVEKFVKIAETQASTNSYFGKIWNITRLISKTTNDWSKIFISLGFDLVNDSGEGIIHDNEPTQAVFLNPKSYKVVGEEFVDTEERYVSTNKALTFSQLSHILLDSDSTKVYQFLINSKEVIKKIIDKNNWLKFVDLITNVLYSSTNDFGAVERHKVIKIYSNIINSAIKSTNYQYVKNLNYIKKEKDISEFVSIFEIHDTYNRIVKKYLSNYDEDLFEYIPQKIVIDDCFYAIYDLIRSKDVAFLNMFTKENLEIIYQECKKEIDELYKSKEKQLPAKLLKIIEKDS